LIELERKEGKSTSIFEQKSLKFVLVNKKHILKQIAKGGGEHLSSALITFNIPKIHHREAITKLHNNFSTLNMQLNAYGFFKEMKKTLKM